MRAVGGWIFAGGFTLGVKRHFDIRCVVEEGAFGVTTARHNQPEIPVYVGIETWPIDELKSEEQIDFIYGNPPCFSGDTKVITENGTSTIKHLVRLKSTEKVLSVAADGTRVFRPINGWHETSYNGFLYDVTRVNYSNGGKIPGRARCTPQHLFLTTEGWKKAVDLASNDRVLTGSAAPSPRQMSLIDGMLLGDGGINEERSWVYTSQISQEYVNLKRDALDNLSSKECVRPARELSDGNTRKPLSLLWLKVGPWSKRERQRWYDSSGKKIVPSDIRIDPISLATWYMDDGTLIKSNRGTSWNAHLCTDGFSQSDVDFLIEKLNEFGIESRRAGSGDTEFRARYPRILITARGMDRFVATIGAYVLPEMRYKLPHWAPEYDHDLWNLGPSVSDWDNVIVEKSEFYSRSSVYCLDVEDTHNFVTYAGVVHNCAAWSSAGGSAIQNKDWRIDPRVKCTRRLFALMEELRPTVWAWESVVPAFTRGRELVDELTCRAVDLGYSVTYLFHNSMHLGVPQQRRRFFMVASKVKFDIADEFMEVIPADLVLARMNDPGEPQERDLKRFLPLLPFVRPGETMIKAWQRETPKPWPLNDRGQVLGRPNITLGRCPIGRPSQVIMSEMIHPTEDRGLSMKELAALCGYPPDYEFIGASPAQQLGRGVCPPVGEWLAKNVKRCIERGEVDPQPVVKSIDCRDPPMVVQIMPVPDPPEPGAAEKPWNYSSRAAGALDDFATDQRISDTRSISFGDYTMGTLPSSGGYRNERSLTAESRSTISIPEGVVALEIPDNLSDDSFDDVKDFIDLTMKRIERRMKRARENGSEATR